MSTKVIYKLVKLEIFKMFRLKLTYFIMLFMLFGALLWVLNSEYLYPNVIKSNIGFMYLINSSQSLLSLLGVIFIIIYCSLLVSTEYYSGTLYINLINPILRHELLFAKLIAGWLFSLLIIICTILPNFIIGGIKFGYNDYIEEGILVFTKNRFFLLLIANILILLVNLLAYVSYSLMISVLTVNPGYSVSISIGIILFLDIIKYKLNISRYLFQSYLEKPFESLKNIVEGFGSDPFYELGQYTVVSFAWIIICFLLALFIFSKKDFKP